MDKKRVLVGISGGIDSLMTAWFLKKEGYNVSGVTFVMDHELIDKYAKKTIEEIVGGLDIEHSFVDISEEFRKTVLQYFKEGYLKGETPNPCTYCNEFVKWPKLKELAAKNDIEYIAMGHYARKTALDGKFCILKGTDREKDQSFFLWGLKSSEITNILLPLGEMTKEDVKQKANDLGLLKLVNKKESTGPCFVENDYREKLYEILDEGEDPGKGVFISENGEVLGTHKGYINYTVTQRRGLGLNTEKALYVKKVIPETNQLVLGDQKSLWRSCFYVRNFHLVLPEIALKHRVEVKIRYRKQKATGRLSVFKNLIHVTLDEPEWGITPGQTAVFYHNDIVLGGGYIHYLE